MSSIRHPSSKEQSRVHRPMTPDRHKPPNKSPRNQLYERYYVDERLRYKQLFLREPKLDTTAVTTGNRTRKLEETEVYSDSKRSDTFNEAFSSNASYRESDVHQRDARENGNEHGRLGSASYHQSHIVEHYYYICVGSPVNTAIGPLRMQERRAVQRLLNQQVSHSEGYTVKGSWLATVWYCSLEKLLKDLENHRIYCIAQHITRQSATYFGDMPTTICLGSKAKTDGSQNDAIWISYVRVPSPTAVKAPTNTEEQNAGIMGTKVANGHDKDELAPVEDLGNIFLTQDYGQSTSLSSNTFRSLLLSPKTKHPSTNKYLNKKWLYKSTSRHHTGNYTHSRRRRTGSSSRRFFDYLRISFSMKFGLSPKERNDSYHSQKFDLDPSLCMPGAWPEEVVYEPKSRPPWQMSPGPYIPGAWPDFFYCRDDFIL